MDVLILAQVWHLTASLSTAVKQTDSKHAMASWSSGRQQRIDRPTAGCGLTHIMPLRLQGRTGDVRWTHPDCRGKGGVRWTHPCWWGSTLTLTVAGGAQSPLGSTSTLTVARGAQSPS